MNLFFKKMKFLSTTHLGIIIVYTKFFKSRIVNFHLKQGKVDKKVLFQKKKK